MFDLTRLATRITGCTVATWLVPGTRARGRRLDEFWGCHYWPVVIVERVIEIAAPAARVRCQLGDVAHHQRAEVHHGVTFEVLADGDDVCRYRQLTRTGRSGPSRSWSSSAMRRVRS